MPEGKGTYGKQRGRPSKPAKKKPPSKKKKDDPFANLKEGALSRSLGIPIEKDIPKSLLKRLKEAKLNSVQEYKGKKIKITALLKKRVNWALNFAK